MPSGNVCKANERRQRNLRDAAGTKATTSDDRKKHEESKNALQCSVCMQGFPKTVRLAELQQHVEARHSKAGKTVADLFPSFVAS